MRDNLGETVERAKSVEGVGIEDGDSTGSGIIRRWCGGVVAVVQVPGNIEAALELERRVRDTASWQWGGRGGWLVRK